MQADTTRFIKRMADEERRQSDADVANEVKEACA